MSAIVPKLALVCDRKQSVVNTKYWYN